MKEQQVKFVPMNRLFEFSKFRFDTHEIVPLFNDGIPWAT